MTTTPRPWEQTIEEYLDGCSVGGSVDRPFSADDLRRYADQTDYMHHATSGDYVFDFNHHQSFRITHAPTGEVAGTFAGGLAYVSPEHRGKGLTSRLYVMCADAGIGRERVRMLTPASLGAFRKAHALMVERAMKAGEQVPLRVLSQYKRAEGGGIMLRKPYGPKECNDRLEFKRNEAQAEKVLAVANAQDASFVRGGIANAADMKAAAFYPDLCRPGAAHGLRVAAEAAKAGEGTIRMIVTSYDRNGDKRYEHLAFGARVGDKVIDAFGATHEAAWADKLKGLGLLGDKVLFPFFTEAPVTPEVHEFATADECVAWMRQEGVTFRRVTMNRDREVEGHAMRSACDHAVRIREPEDAVKITGL